MNVCPKCGAAAWKSVLREIAGLPPFVYFNCGSTSDERSEQCRITELETALSRLVNACGPYTVPGNSLDAVRSGAIKLLGGKTNGL